MKFPNPKITIFTFATLSGLKEGFFIILGPFLPEQMEIKGINQSYFASIYV